jgi:hypothetical protein
MTQERFAQYLAAVRQAANEETIRLSFLDLVREAMGIDLGAFQVEERVFSGGRIDALLGSLVFEFKRDLQRDEADAVGQLARYITSLRQKSPSHAHTGIASDGVTLKVFRPTSATGPLTRDDLQPAGSLDLGSVPWRDAHLWLDGLFSHFRNTPLPATAQSVAAGLGEASPTFRAAAIGLRTLFGRVRSDPAVDVKFSQWRRYLAIVYGQEPDDPTLFIKHTYLSTLARLIALFRLDPARVMNVVARELHTVIDGDYFTKNNVFNFVDEDFFTWYLADACRDEALALVRRIAHTLRGYDFSQVDEDALKGLYEGLVDPETRHDLGEYYTPDWLAEYILREELKLPDDPYRGLLDPSCGSGTFLFMAVRLIRQALMEREGKDAFDTVFHLQDHIAGIDVHPMAVAIARTNYLLALGPILSGPRPDITIPIYLADAIRLPEERPALQGVQEEEPVYPVPAQGEGETFELPMNVVRNAALFDLVIRRFQQYLEASRREPQNIDRIAGTFRTFLKSRKHARTGAPEPLSDYAADVLTSTFRALDRLQQKQRDSVWVFILKNAPMPRFLSERRFDLVVGNPPWLSLRYFRSAAYQQWFRRMSLDYNVMDKSKPHLFTQMELATLFMARAADLYLNAGGRIAFVMPRSVMVAQQHARFTEFSFGTPVHPSIPSPSTGEGKGEGETPRRAGAGQEERSATIHLDKILDLEGVKPLFNVPSCVLIATRQGRTAYPVDGLRFSGTLPVRNAGWDDAAQRLTREPVQYVRAEGRLMPQGQAAALAPALGKSHYADKFY